MDELFAQQAAVLRRSISGYREAALDLNSLIQRVEGRGDDCHARWRPVRARHRVEHHAAV